MYRLPQRTGDRIEVVELDVLSESSVERAMSHIVERAGGRVDVLINNAGIAYAGVSEGFTVDQVRDQLEHNVLGVVRTNRAALPHMRKARSGLLIHVSSLASRVSIPCFGIYGASKAALESIAESYRYELADLGIDSVIVEPGPYPTSITPKPPSDIQRLGEYQGAARIAERIMAGFQQLFGSPTPPDPNDVVGAFSALIESNGPRPLRTVVASSAGDWGVRRLNDAAAAVQREFLEGLGVQP